MSQTDVLIVGAGPTGLLLAVWLKTLKRNINIRIIDRANGPGTTSRALVIHARTLEFYRQLGIVDAVLQHGSKLQNVSMSSNGRLRGMLVFGDVGKGQSKYPYMISYPQDQHERLLVKHLMSLGVEVEWNSEVVDLMQADDTVKVSLKDSADPIEARFVAGCDGSHSAVRVKAGIDLEGGTYPSRFYVADGVLAHAGSVTESLAISAGAKGFVMTFPIGDNGLVRVLGNVPNDADEEVQFDDIRYSHVERLTRLPIASVNWSSIYKVHHRVASQFRKGNVFLLGDAAHHHSPVGGQGMNTGLGDATNLAWKLVDTLNHQARDDLLNTYETERIGFAKTLVNTTDRVFSFVINKGWLGYFMRAVVLPIILPLIWKIPMAPPRLFRMVSQTAITYRDGPLVGGLKSGDRLPWIDYGDTDNFECLDECCWQVHRYCEKSHDQEDSIEDIPIKYLPSTEKARAAGLMPNDDILVRPDGHIAMITRRSQNEQIVKFMRQRA